MPLKKGARAPDYLCLCLINIKSAVLDSQGCGAPLRGGRYVTIPSPLGIIPVMIREGSSINEIKGFEPTC